MNGRKWVSAALMALREGACDLRQQGDQADEGTFRERVEPKVAIFAQPPEKVHSRLSEFA